MIGSIIGIFKLQDAYLIKPTEFENVSKNHPSFKLTGLNQNCLVWLRINSILTSILKANDCFYIGSTGFEKQYYKHGLTWFKAGYNLWKKQEKKLEIKLIMNRLLDSARKVSSIFKKFSHIYFYSKIFF